VTGSVEKSGAIFRPASPPGDAARPPRGAPSSPPSGFPPLWKGAVDTYGDSFL
jgi:hypothetical protein